MIVITGSESFIGRRLTAQLGAAAIPWLGIDSTADGARGVCADIRDPEIVRHIPESADAIVHLAAISRDADCRANPRAAFDVNVGGTINLIEITRQRRVRQFIFASSEWVYGDVANADTQKEDSVIDASKVTSEYALTKICGERLLAAEFQRGGIPAATVLRFGIVYGPRDRNWSAVEALHHAVHTKPLVEVRGSLRTSRRFIHVEDVASGIRCALNRRGFEIFNLSGDRLISLGEIIEASSNLAGRSPQVAEFDAGAVSIRNPDNGLARQKLQWNPRYSLRDGLAGLAVSHAG